MTKTKKLKVKLKRYKERYETLGGWSVGDDHVVEAPNSVQQVRDLDEKAESWVRAHSSFALWNPNFHKMSYGLDSEGVPGIRF